ncbi:hypothetical protein [Aeromonas caviae]|uniref:hypothetical protein n=1 Tax=Aeromonas caviae TaxID=648 RepID=UPI00160507A4|nr:hypothetical protein [Aeromonas caviae]
MPAIKGKGAVSDVQAAEISAIYRTFSVWNLVEKVLKNAKISAVQYASSISFSGSI